MIIILLDAATVILGSLLGMLLRKSMSQTISKAVMVGIGLYVIYVGVTGLSTDVNTIAVMLSLIIGAVLGTALDIDGRLSALGNRLEQRLSAADSENRVAKGFVSMTMLSCTGAFTFLASVNAGMGSYHMMYTKMVMDIFVSMTLSASLGIGVPFASIVIFLYQAVLALLGDLLSPLLTGELLQAFSCVGAILTIPIGTNLVGMSDVKVSNYIPAILLAPVITALLNMIS